MTRLFDREWLYTVPGRWPRMYEFCWSYFPGGRRRRKEHEESWAFARQEISRSGPEALMTIRVAGEARRQNSRWERTFTPPIPGVKIIPASEPPDGDDTDRDQG